MRFDLQEGSATSEQVMAFVEALTKEVAPEGVTVVVLDNAGFHTSSKGKRKKPKHHPAKLVP